MTEAAIAAAVAPLEAAALEDLHQLASAEIERLEKTVPPRLAAAEQDVQDWAHDAVNTLHGLVARIDQHRQGARYMPASPAGAVPPTPPAASSAPTASTSSASTPASTAAATPSFTSAATK